MALPLANTFEGGSDGTTINVGNSGGGSGDAFDGVNNLGTSSSEFDSSKAMHGALSCQFNVDASGNTCSVDYSTSMGTQTEIWWRAYVFHSATPAAQHRLFRWYDSSVTEAGRISWHTDAKIYSFDSTLAVPPASSFTLTANQWLRFEVHLLCSATVGEIEVKAYVGDSESAIGTYTRTGVNTLADVASIKFGNTVTADPGDPFWMDDIAINATGYPGPSVTGTGEPLRTVRSSLRW